MAFISDFNPPPGVADNALWFLFQGWEMLAKNHDGNYSVLRSSDLEALHLEPGHQQYLGSLDGRDCYAGELPEGTSVTDPLTLLGLRTLYRRIEENIFWVAGLASQLVYWNKNHLYCGKCGNPTENKTDERAKSCPHCGLVNYPRLSPAVIVAVIKGDRILLAHSQRFPAKFHSVLAGFVEPGETLEGCVQREIREEVGIAVKNIRYFGSQPWPFPDSLMIGFTAEYDSGEIEIDTSEIVHADWYSAESLPPIPPRLSIARELIDWFSAGMPR